MPDFTVPASVIELLISGCLQQPEYKAESSKATARLRWLTLKYKLKAHVKQACRTADGLLYLCL